MPVTSIRPDRGNLSTERLSVDGVGAPDVSQQNLLAAATHELRVPLGALTLGLDILLDQSDQLSSEEARSVLLRVQRSAAWMRALVDNLSLAAQNTQGTLPLSRTVVNLHECIQTSLAIVQSFLDRRDQSTRVLCPSQVLVWGDCWRLQHVLVNLLINASKYGLPSSDIQLIVRPSGKWVRIQVDNLGPGILPSERDRIFGRYVRGDAATRMGTGGLGLGLYIVKTVVERHGGRVGVESTPGTGASFWFTLPACKADGAEPSGSKGAGGDTNEDSLGRRRYRPG